MSTVAYRFDYAKFVCTVPRGLWHSYYRAMNEESHKLKLHGEWLRSHKVTAWPSQSPDYETTCIEIWGEWTAIVERLPFDVWAPWLKRLDVRAALWDVSGEAILHTGQTIQRASCGYNVEVFNSKPASKRLGRDRGGQGFRIGSRKSDICAVIYKRTGEPSAVEFRFQGQALRNLLTPNLELAASFGEVCSAWYALRDDARVKGERRLQVAYNAAGIGDYYPTFARVDVEGYSPLQQSFAAIRAELGTDPGPAFDQILDDTNAGPHWQP